MAGLITCAHVKRALALKDFDSAAARNRMAPVPRGWQQRADPPKRAAVLILIYRSSEAGVKTVLTLRNKSLRGHSGQVSFPGGQRDAADATLADTALREAREEIGLCAGGLRVLGELPSFYIPASHYDVAPVVAFQALPPIFALNPAEVAAVFSFALDDLLRDSFKGVERRIIRGHEVRVPYYLVAGHKVWGATAMLLSGLEWRLRKVLPSAVMSTLE